MKCFLHVGNASNKSDAAGCQSGPLHFLRFRYLAALRYASEGTRGTRNTVNATETKSPPIRARASGAYDSLPSPSFKAIGISPMIVASEVNQMDQAHPAGFDYSFAHSPAFHLQMVSEFDNENAVRHRDSCQHHYSHQRHHVQRRACENQHHQSAGDSRWQGQQDDEGVHERSGLSHQN